ncbi:MAG: DUF3516 domain-containing protein, partial [Verrucomicrobiota bacterium]
KGALALVQGQDPQGEDWTPTRLEAFVLPYFENHAVIRLDPEARNRQHTHLDEQPKQWRVEQVLVDSDEDNDWSIVFQVDLPASDQANEVVLTLAGVGPIDGMAEG